MPIQRCKSNGKTGWKWGQSGKCYVGVGARTKARRQERAIRASGWTENATDLGNDSNFHNSDNDDNSSGRCMEEIEDEFLRSPDIRDAVWDVDSIYDSVHNRFSEKINESLDTVSGDTIHSNTASVHLAGNQRTEVVPSNPLKSDPTRTATLRRIFQNDMSRRFNLLKRDIVKLIVEEDAFGLKPRPMNPFNQEHGNDGNSSMFVSGRSSMDSVLGSRFNQSSQGTADAREGSEGPRGEIETVRPQELRSNHGVPNIGIDGSDLLFQLESGKECTQEDTETGRRYTTDADAEPGNTQLGKTKVPYNVGLKSNIRVGLVNQRFMFMSTPDQVNAFRLWLASRVKLRIAKTAAEEAEDAWWQKYVEDGYKKGAGRAFDDTKAVQKAIASSDQQLAFFAGSKDQFLRQSFARPVAVQKVKLLAGRVFTELSGITETMAQVLTRTLTDGLVQGKSPRDIGRDISKNVDISRGRANTIARTEIIRSHAEGQLDAMEELGVAEVGVAVEWSTTGDHKVCSKCRPLHGVVFKIADARGLIPRHPNCRCSHIPANVGEPVEGQKRTKSSIAKAIETSLKSDIPKKSKRSLAKQKSISTWPGADVKPKKAPVGII